MTSADLLKALPRHATGTTITGPGSASSDSVLRWLSIGEEVTSNLRGQASRNRPTLKAINSGDDTRIRRTAAEQYGTSAAQQPVQVIVQARDGAPDFTDYIDVRVVQGVQTEQARNARQVRKGRLKLGLGVSV